MVNRSILRFWEMNWVGYYLILILLGRIVIMGDGIWSFFIEEIVFGSSI